MLHTAILLLLASAALALGLTLAQPRIALRADQPGADTILRDFGIVESNETATYRWSLAKSAIDLGDLGRTPSVLTLRMAAPRSWDAPPAEAFFVTDEWRVGTFLVGQEWRRYRVLLPPAPANGEPIKLRVTPWVPGENDRRELGAAITTLAAASAALAAPQQIALAVLGLPRAVTLALLPLLAYAAARGLPRRTKNEVHKKPFGPLRSSSFVVHLPFAVALLALIPVALLAAQPLAAGSIPETWLLPAALATTLGLAAVQPQLDAAGRMLAQAIPERARVALALAAALCQGLLYQTMVPPWQHYDEPSHFEYAWLYAEHGERPAFDSGDTAMRREVTASMVESGFYAPKIPAPPLLSDDGALQLSGGGTATGHQPWYYALLSLPLRLVRHLDIASQLAVARAVSLGFWMLTVLAAAGVARELTSPGHVLRWLLPLAVAGVAPVADLMAAVNNDVPVIAFTSLFVWGAVRVLRRGLSWQTIGWVFAAALGASLVKNTGVIALAFAPAVCLTAWAIQRRRLRSLVAFSGLIAVVLVLALVAWDDASMWYRRAWPSQEPATRAAIAEAAPQLGSHALLLQLDSQSFPPYLTSPIAAANLDELRGQRATIGGWVWSSRPAFVYLGMLVHGERDGTIIVERFEVSPTPTFHAIVVEVPRDARQVQVLVGGDVQEVGQELDLYFDGTLLVRGRFPTDTPPAFDGPNLAAGTWGGRAFVNLARNPSIEERGPRLRPQVDATVSRYLRRQVSAVLMSISDLGLSAQTVYVVIAPELVDGLFTRFGWGSELLRGAGWDWLFRGLALAALVGCLRWLLGAGAGRAATRPVVIALGLFAAALWFAALLRLHPLVETANLLTSARYAFPAIIPTVLALVGGWLHLWPARLRSYGLVLLVAALLAYNTIAAAAVWSFADALR
jgi:hypothetical protein